MAQDSTGRDAHMAWTKQRALEYVDQGDVVNALSSLFSDLGKHPATRDHGAIELGGMLAFTGHLQTPAQVREFIEGCN